MNIGNNENWYNWVCKANPLPEGIDFVTGKKGYISKNSLGMTIFTEDQKFQYSKNLNPEGMCVEYRPVY